MSFLAVPDRVVAAGEDRHLRFFGDAASGQLVAELLQHFDAGADKNHAGLAARLGKQGIFREKAVAGMNGVDIVLAGQVDDGVDVQIRTQRLAGFADAIRFIGLEAVQGEAVFVGVDGHGPNAQLMCGAEDTNGNLTTISDEKFADGTGRCH